MHSPERKRLLKDVLNEGSSGDFRAELFEESLREFRRARRTKRLWPLLALAAAVVFSAPAWHLFYSRPAPLGTSAAIQQPSVNPDWLVKTIPLPAASYMESKPNHSLVVRTTKSSVSSIVVVQTSVAPALLTDPELLAHFPYQGAGIVEAEGIKRLMVVVSEKDLL